MPATATISSSNSGIGKNGARFLLPTVKRTSTSCAMWNLCLTANLLTNDEGQMEVEIKRHEIGYRCRRDSQPPQPSTSTHFIGATRGKITCDRRKKKKIRCDRHPPICIRCTKFRVQPPKSEIDPVPDTTALCLWRLIQLDSERSLLPFRTPGFPTLAS